MPALSSARIAFVLSFFMSFPHAALIDLLIPFVKITGHGDLFAEDRMQEGKFYGAEPQGQRGALSVERIADQRMACGRQVHTDLMAPSGL